MNLLPSPHRTTPSLSLGKLCVNICIVSCVCLTDSGLRLMLRCWRREWQGNGKVKNINIHFKLLWCIIVKWMTFIFSFCPFFVYEFSTKATHDSARIRNSLVRCGVQTAPSRHPWVARAGGSERRGVFS